MDSKNKENPCPNHGQADFSSKEKNYLGTP
jgi:hypothetical protein